MMRNIKLNHFTTPYFDIEPVGELQNICIDTIVNNFEGYFSKFYNSENAVLKREFEFLQRKFSYEMASSLYFKSRRGEKNKYIVDFFVNRYLKKLDFNWFPDDSLKKIVAKFQEFGPALQSLELKYYDGMPLQELIRYLRNLRVLTYHWKCNDEILKCLAECCPKLLQLNIEYSYDITKAGIKHLCTKDDGENTGLKLRRICLDHCGRHDEAVAYLIKHMPTLEIIDYSGLPDILYSMHKNDLLKIGKMEPYNLQKLEFDLRYDDDILDTTLEICSSLCPRVTDLSCTIYRGPEDLKYIVAFQELEQLTLINKSEWEVEIDQLLELRGKKLRYLLANSVSVSVFALANYCPSLERLDLEAVYLKNDNMSSVEFLSLKICLLNCVNTDSAGPIGRICRSSHSLEHLYLLDCFLMEQADALMYCEGNPFKRINFTDVKADSKSLLVAFIRNILDICPFLKRLSLGEELDSSAEAELKEIAQSLPNSPEILVERMPRFTFGN